MTLEEFTQLIASHKLLYHTTNGAYSQNYPASLSLALQSLWYDKLGDWHQAHNIVQNAGDIDSAWVHAYLHRKEGDLSNARYWYRRSRQPECTADLEQEWEQIVTKLLLKESSKSG